MPDLGNFRMGGRAGLVQPEEPIPPTNQGRGERQEEQRVLEELLRSAELSGESLNHAEIDNALRTVYSGAGPTHGCIKCLHSFEEIKQKDKTSYCVECYSVLRECSVCKDKVMLPNQVDKAHFCTPCFRNTYYVCDGCGKPHVREELTPSATNNKTWCKMCFGKNEKKKKTTKYQSDKPTDVAGSRTFGVELETLVERKTYDALVGELPKDLKVVGDGSIHIESDTQAGVEFVTPVLKGAKGIQYVSGLVDVLNKYKVTVNKSCGMHLHIGMDDVKNEIPRMYRTVMQANGITDLKVQVDKVLDRFGIMGYNVQVLAYPESQLELADKDEVDMRIDAQEYRRIYNSDNSHLTNISVSRDYRTSKRARIQLYYKAEARISTKDTGGVIYYTLIATSNKGRNKLLWMNNVYATFDSVLRGFFDQWRRDNNFSVANKYIPESTVPVTKTNDGTQKLIHGIPVASTKYAGLNLHAIERHGTLEIRHHHGTVDKAEIINWITLHQNIFDFVAKYVDADDTSFLKGFCHEGDYFVTPLFKFKYLTSALFNLPPSVIEFYRSRLMKVQEEDEKCLERVQTSESEQRLDWSHIKANRRRTQI